MGRDYLACIAIWLSSFIVGLFIFCAQPCQGQTIETSIVNPCYHIGQLPYTEVAFGIWLPTQYENVNLSLRYNTNGRVGSAGFTWTYKELYFRVAPITTRTSVKDTYQVGFLFTQNAFMYVTKGEIGFTYLWR
jgi:hypothetical protein